MFPGQYLRQVNRDERKVLMLLENKNAIVYGAGGAIGGAVARAFARDVARVFLAGRGSGLTGTIVNLSCGSIAD